MKLPVLILSDLHLGHKASWIDTIEKLRPLLHGCGTLLLNGDSWQELARDFREEGARLFQSLERMCQENGIELITLPGNHDPGQGDASYATLAAGKIVVTHGDCVFPEGAPWSRIAIKKQHQIAALWAAHPVDNIEQRAALGKTIARLLIPPWYGHSRHFLMRLWDALMPPERALRMLLSWWHMVAQTRVFSQRYFPTAEIMICGHFHRAGIWDDKQLLVINTGAYMPPGSAYWCEWRPPFFTVGRVKRDDTYFTRGEILGVWRVES